MRAWYFADFASSYSMFRKLATWTTLFLASGAVAGLLAKHPDAALFGMRIGYDAVYSLGGVLTRTERS